MTLMDFLTRLQPLLTLKHSEEYLNKNGRIKVMFVRDSSGQGVSSCHKQNLKALLNGSFWQIIIVQSWIGLLARWQRLLIVFAKQLIPANTILLWRVIYNVLCIYRKLLCWSKSTPDEDRRVVVVPQADRRCHRFLLYFPLRCFSPIWYLNVWAGCKESYSSHAEKAHRYCDRHAVLHVKYMKVRFWLPEV